MWQLWKEEQINTYQRVLPWETNKSITWPNNKKVTEFEKGVYKAIQTDERTEFGDIILEFMTNN